MRSNTAGAAGSWRACAARWTRSASRSTLFPYTTLFRSQIIIEVGCSCGASPVRRTVLGLREAYYLDVEVRQEGEEKDEHTDPGDIPQG